MLVNNSAAWLISELFGTVSLWSRLAVSTPHSIELWVSLELALLYKALAPA